MREKREGHDTARSASRAGRGLCVTRTHTHKGREREGDGRSREKTRRMEERKEPDKGRSNDEETIFGVGRATARHGMARASLHACTEPSRPPPRPHDAGQRTGEKETRKKRRSVRSDPPSCTDEVLSLVKWAPVRHGGSRGRLHAADCSAGSATGSGGRCSARRLCFLQASFFYSFRFLALLFSGLAWLSSLPSRDAPLT